MVCLFLDGVFSGAHRSLWANYRIRPDRFNFLKVGASQAISNVRKLARHYRKYRVKEQEGVIVKFIRANLKLPWIVRQYRVPVLFVTRHPCAVIASRLKLGGSDWVSQEELDRYRSSPDVIQLVKDEFNVDITRSFSPVAALACVWCIENLLPLRWADDAGYMVTAYEKLVVDDEAEWDRVISGLGLSQVPKSKHRALPSQQVSNEMKGKVFSGSHMGKWRQVLTGDQINEVSLILDQFFCQIYSVEKDFPLG